ncbi:MAG: phage terminase small subunit P27 family [Acetobacteraceae bacterium]|nr:phage terminase small subunit P27 family [Acetobacteraceae bacterium]
MWTARPSNFYAVNLRPFPATIPFMPQRKSDTLKLISGTSRRDRLPRSDPTLRLTEPPAPPSHLSERAAAEWNRLAQELVAAGVLTGGDLRSLELLAETLALEAEMRTLIAAEGATIPSGEGGRKGHPALKIATDARAQAIRLLEGFGMTPSSRQRVDRCAPAATSADSPWTRLRELQGAKAGG